MYLQVTVLVKYIGEDSAPIPISNFQSGVYEFGASISSDGKFIVQVVWTDQDMSTIQVLIAKSRIDRRKVVRLSDSQRFNVTTSSGRYTQPSFSPSNDKIVFLKLGADDLRFREFYHKLIE